MARNRIKYHQRKLFRKVYHCFLYYIAGIFHVSDDVISFHLPTTLNQADRFYTNQINRVAHQNLPINSTASNLNYDTILSHQNFKQKFQKDGQFHQLKYLILEDKSNKDFDHTKQMVGKLFEIGEILEKEYQISLDEFSTLLNRVPNFLKYKVDELEEHTKLFHTLKCDLGLGKNEMREIFLKCPKILIYPVLNLEKMLDILRNECEMTDTQIRTAITKKPDILMANHLKSMCCIEFLKDFIGLQPASVGKILTSYPKMLAHSVEKTLKPVLWYMRDGVGLSRDQLRRVVQACPQLLANSLEKNLVPKLLWLRNDVHLSKKQLKKVLLSYPSILLQALENLALKVHYLTAVLKLSSGQLKKVIVSNPQVLRPSLQKMMRTEEWLKHELGMSSEELKSLLVHTPSAFGYSIEDNLEMKKKMLIESFHFSPEEVKEMFLRHSHGICYSVSTMEAFKDFFEEEYGFTRKEVKKMIYRHPQTMGLSIEHNLKPTLQWLHNEVGLQAHQLQRVILSHPQILGLSITENMEPTIQFLKENIQLNDNQLRLVIGRSPSILSFSLTKNLKPTIEFLRNDLQMNDKEISEAIASFSPLLGLSLDQNLKPKFAWFQQQLGGGPEIIKELRTNPRLLSYSLESRLKPRMQLIKESKVSCSAKNLSQICIYSEEQFSRWLEKRMEGARR